MNRSQNQTRTRTNTQRFHREGSGPGVPATDAALAVEGASVRMRMLAGAQTFGGPVTRPACISRALRARSRCGTYKRGRGLEVRVHLLKLMCRRGLRRTTAAGRCGHCLRSTHLSTRRSRPRSPGHCGRTVKLAGLTQDGQGPPGRVRFATAPIRHVCGTA
jgi:hypothetical protein